MPDVSYLMVSAVYWIASCAPRDVARAARIGLWAL